MLLLVGLTLTSCKGGPPPPPPQASAHAPASQSTTTLQPGAPAPPISLPTADGRTFDLAAALAGGPVVLVFYRGHW